MKICKYISLFICMISLFVLLNFLGSLIDSSLLYDNVKKSSDILLKEGKNVHVFGWSNIYNLADPLMINEAYSVDCTNPLYSSMAVRKNYNKDLTKTIIKDYNGNLITFQKDDKDNRLIELDGQLFFVSPQEDIDNYKQELINNDTVLDNRILVEINGEEYLLAEYDTGKELASFLKGDVDISVEYARYWHGYLPFLRTLLILFDILEIRIIIIIFLLIFLFVVINLMRKDFGNRIAIIFLLFLLVNNYITLGYTLQTSPLLILMIIASYIMIKKKGKFKDVNTFFLIVGCITNYIDYLTNPILTLCLPLILYILYIQKDNCNIDLLDYFKIIIKASIFWLFGYALTWGAKWILFDVLFNGEIIKLALNQVMFRTIGNPIKSQESLFSCLILPIVYNMFFALVYFVFVFLEGNIKFNKLNKQVFYDIFPFLIIMFMPLVWYIVLRNHTIMHWGFSAKGLMIIPICILIIVEKLILKKVNKI